MKKYIQINIFTGKRSDSVLLSAVAGLNAYSFMKKDSILDDFCEVCEVLQNLIFREDC